MPALVILFIVMVKPAVQVGLLEASTSVVGTLTIVALALVCLFLFKFVLHLLLAKWSQALHIETLSSRTGTTKVEEMYVPGALPSGMGKVDEETRRKLYTPLGRGKSEKEEDVTVPPSPNELRAQRDSKRS